MGGTEGTVLSRSGRTWNGENRPRQFHRYNPFLYVNMQNKKDGEANLENKEPFFGKLVMGDGNVYNGMNGERRIGGDVIG